MVSDIFLRKFPTHIEYTDNKKAPNKFVKVNNQSIYNGKIGRFSRNIVVTNLHNYVMGQIDVKLLIPLMPKNPFKVEYIIRTVKNHGSISRRSGKISWKPPEPNYVPTWDADNLAFLWIKVINDALVMSGLIPDDNVNYIIGGRYEIQYVKDLEDREIIIKFI